MSREYGQVRNHGGCGGDGREATGREQETEYEKQNVKIYGVYTVGCYSGIWLNVLLSFLYAVHSAAGLQ